MMESIWIMPSSTARSIDCSALQNDPRNPSRSSRKARTSARDLLKRSVLPADAGFGDACRHHCANDRRQFLAAEALQRLQRIREHIAMPLQTEIDDLDLTLQLRAMDAGAGAGPSGAVAAEQGGGERGGAGGVGDAHL